MSCSFKRFRKAFAELRYHHLSDNTVVWRKLGLKFWKKHLKATLSLNQLTSKLNNVLVNDETSRLIIWNLRGAIFNVLSSKIKGKLSIAFVRRERKATELFSLYLYLVFWNDHYAVKLWSSPRMCCLNLCNAPVGILPKYAQRATTLSYSHAITKFIAQSLLSVTVTLWLLCNKCSSFSLNEFEVSRRIHICYSLPIFPFSNLSILTFPG